MDTLTNTVMPLPTESKTAKVIIVRVKPETIGFWHLPEGEGKPVKFLITPVKQESDDMVWATKKEAEMWSVYAVVESGLRYCIADLPTEEVACAFVSLVCSLSPDLENLEIDVLG